MKSSFNIPALCLCLSFLMAGFCHPLFAQKKTYEDDPGKQAFLNELIENLAEDTEDADIDIENYLERWNDLLKHPININKADFDDFSELGLLNAAQINGILDHREKFGDFLAVYELQSVPILDMRTLFLISPFITTGSFENFNVPFGELVFGGRHQFLARFEQVLESKRGYEQIDTNYLFLAGSTQTLETFEIDQTGFDTLQNTVVLDTSGYTTKSRYLGNPMRLYARYRYNYGNKISYGMTAEKDPGEQFFKDTQKRGFDFYSGHFYVRDVGPFQHIALGDFEVRFGQGLIAWSGLATRKGSYVMNIVKQGPPLRPYTSVNETLFFRGAGVTLGWGQKQNWQLTAFGSYKRTDANIVETAILPDDSDADLSGITVSSVQISGYHRTEAELADKNAIKQFNSGASFKYNSRKLKLGLNTVFTRFNADLRSSSNAYNLFRFGGNQLINASVDYNFLVKNLNFFGETALSDNGGIATVNGILMGLDPKVSVSVAHRYYDRKYQSLYATPFAEGTRPDNETGFFIGTILTPHKSVTVNAYFDMYRHPWLKSKADGPSHGRDYLLLLTWKPKRNVFMMLRFRDETKKQNVSGNATRADFLTDHRRSGLRYHVQYTFGKALTLKTRAEFSWFSDGVNERENGMALMQDFIYKPLSFPLSFATRLAVFNTDSYNTRIYAYENDVLYAYNVPPYYNKGTRFYIMLRYKVVRGLDVWFRFAQTYYANENHFGSGNERINGRVKSEIKAMMRLQFGSS